MSAIDFLHACREGRMVEYLRGEDTSKSVPGVTIEEEGDRVFTRVQFRGDDAYTSDPEREAELREAFHNDPLASDGEIVWRPGAPQQEQQQQSPQK
jgi:hypothetical protein